MKYYQVDSEMLGSDWCGNREDLLYFCEVLQELVGNDIEIVPITSSGNGAENENPDLVNMEIWNEACENCAEFFDV